MEAINEALKLLAQAKDLADSIDSTTADATLDETLDVIEVLIQKCIDKLS